MSRPRIVLISSIVISIAFLLYAQLIDRDVYIAVSATVLVGGILFWKLDKIEQLLKKENSD